MLKPFYLILTIHFKCYFVWELNLLFTLREELYFEMLTKLVKKPEEKTPLGRSMRKLDDNIKMDPNEIRRDIDWITLAQEPFAGFCELGKVEELSDWLSDYLILKKNSVPGVEVRNKKD
jgi:hypothetical protein